MAWLSVCNQEDSKLESELTSSAEAAFKKHNFEPHSLQYISKLDRSIDLSGGETVVDEKLIEKLRTLCKFWDVEANFTQISSHRKIIGPVIVKSKKILFSVLKVLLKAPFEKQRNFNAQVLEVLVDMAKNLKKN